MLVAAEKEFEDFKLFKRQEYTNMYTDLVDWLCFLYDHPRLKLLEEQTKTITQAHGQMLKITQSIEAKEKSLREDRDTIENRLITQKKKFQEDLDKIKIELDKFREYNTSRKEDEYNKQIAALNAELISMTQQMRDINE